MKSNWRGKANLVIQTLTAILKTILKTIKIYLTVKPKSEQHKEENNGPECR